MLIRNLRHMDHMGVIHTCLQQNKAMRRAFPVFLWAVGWGYHQHKHILYACVQHFLPWGIRYIPSSSRLDRHYAQGSWVSLNENLLHKQHKERCCDGEIDQMGIYCLSHQARIHCHTLLTLFAHLTSLCCILAAKASKRSFLHRQQQYNMSHRFHLKLTRFTLLLQENLSIFLQ